MAGVIAAGAHSGLVYSPILEGTLRFVLFENIVPIAITIAKIIRYATTAIL